MQNRIDKINKMFLLYYILYRILHHAFCPQHTSYPKLSSENLMDSGTVIFNMNKPRSKNVELAMFFVGMGQKPH